MKKIDFIVKVATAVFGKGVYIESGESGQHYRMSGAGVRTIWVDELGGGRVSIKIKYFDLMHPKEVIQCMERLKEWLKTAPQSEIFVDAATKVDVYQDRSPRWGGVGVGVLRLRCDKMW